MIGMTDVVIFIAGFLAAVVAYLLFRKSNKWYVWVLTLGLYAWILAGVSFVTINSTGYHPKAVAVGITFFGIIAVIWGLVVARLMGYIGKKKAAKVKEAA